ncbi:hypothetical protein TNIN_492651 [Trichonephila inaurata madagascariensis]|uniref:Uncharacterized protein n=1 Tax=Trichonephila inaurata madagascariensis TaxID=2747483 RepID=A0A8X6YIX3_9ARAC|nr:hypothetical protein TNIN_492651 [Trichonephila inaurata madagascariensis]
MYIPKLHALVIPEDDIQHQSSFDSGVIMTIVQDPILWLQLSNLHVSLSSVRQQLSRYIYFDLPKLGRMKFQRFATETVMIGSLSVLVQYRRGQQSRTWSWIVQRCLYAYPRDLWPLKERATSES